MKLVDTQPIFIVGSGRNGTRSIFRMLRGNSKIEAHHEYLCENIQKVSCLYSMNLISKERCMEEVFKHYHSAILYSQKKIWLDSSNKASWIIDVLSEIFPNSKFIHLIRDPRRVVASFYYKLREEMYDKNSVNALACWINQGLNMKNIPPAEKKYWWKLKLNKQNKVDEDEIGSERFYKVCRHWLEINEVIENAFSNLSSDRFITFKLEELVESKKYLNLFLDFFDLDHNCFYHEFLQKPRNVFLPMEFSCTKNQQEILKNICGNKASQFGYDLDLNLSAINY